MSDKKSRLIELGIHRRKLVNLVGELLAQADELDQLTGNGGAVHLHLPPDWHERLASTCSDLAALSQAADALEPMIKAGKANEAEEALLRCVNIARHLSKRVNELKQQAKR